MAMQLAYTAVLPQISVRSVGMISRVKWCWLLSRSDQVLPKPLYPPRGGRDHHKDRLTLFGPPGILCPVCVQQAKQIIYGGYHIGILLSSRAALDKAT